MRSSMARETFLWVRGSIRFRLPLDNIYDVRMDRHATRSL
jgi:hypothetical protein